MVCLSGLEHCIVVKATVAVVRLLKGFVVSRSFIVRIWDVVVFPKPVHKYSNMGIGYFIFRVLVFLTIYMYAFVAGK